MRKLGDRNYTLISQAVKIHGSFNPKEILYLFEEQLYTNEFDEIVAFLTWVHESGKMFGSGNYEEVFSEWKKTTQKKVNNTSGKVAKLVCVSLMTRIVVEDSLTEEELLQEIRQTAFPKFHAQLCEDGVGDHLESIEDDTECPYGTMEGEK